MPEAENHALPPATNDSWRTWLMTGNQRVPVDRRRLRGAHRGLKKMLIEGMANGPDMARASWKNFSGAMIRHAVDEAMRELPIEEKQMVKLAYFGGLSNREIAQHIGMTEASVQRRLRRAIDTISEYIERGRSLGRRAFYALMVWLSARWVGDATHHLVQAAAVVTVSAVIVAQPVAPTTPTQASPPVNNAQHANPSAPAASHEVAPPSKPTSVPTDEHKQLPISSLPKVEVPPISVPVAIPSPPVNLLVP